MFDWENAIALHAMQGNRAYTNPEAEKHSFLGESRGKETAAMKRMKKRQVLTDQVRRF